MNKIYKDRGTRYTKTEEQDIQRERKKIPSKGLRAKLICKC